MQNAFMYILECSDGSYYTGSTTDIQRRLNEHQTGSGSYYTRKRLPVRLVHLAAFNSIEEAFKREKQVQGWSRKKKQALIDSSFPDLVPLSKGYKWRKE
jgi:putative endonuclease